MNLTITDGPGDGSIDLHGKSDDCEILVNISPDKISYYGDNYGKKSIKGEIDSFKDFIELFKWLDEIKFERIRQAQIIMEGDKP